MSRPSYPSDLSDAEWAVVTPPLPRPKKVSSPRQVNLREVLNAQFYVLDNGIKWRGLPHDFSPWQTVYGYFRRWSEWGVLDQLNRELTRRVRQQDARHEQPSLVIVDSQSVKQSAKGEQSKALMGVNESRGANDICS
ncbi:MAG: transposase [Cyanobacteria bacterium J06642_2]